MSQSDPSPPGGADPTALRAQFDAEIFAADVTVPDADREPLFTMWLAQRSVRERLRTARIALEEEPSFTQKPAQLGAGLTLPATSTNGGPT
jgi:hypothetical protein